MACVALELVMPEAEACGNGYVTVAPPRRQGRSNGIPLELYTHVGTNYIASALGVPLYMNRITAEKSKLAYVKVWGEERWVPKVEPPGEVSKQEGEKVGDKLPIKAGREVISASSGGVSKNVRVLESSNRFAILCDVAKVADIEEWELISDVVESVDVGGNPEGVSAVPFDLVMLSDSSSILGENVSRSSRDLGEMGVKGNDASFSKGSGSKIDSILVVQRVSFMWFMVEMMVLADILWNHLQDFHGMISDVLWMLAGDFNIILDPQENSNFCGSMDVSRDMKDFQHCVREMGVLDHSCIGPLFTWSNHQLERALSRKLDRVMVNANWNLGFLSSFMEFMDPGIFLSLFDVYGCVQADRLFQKLKRLKGLSKECYSDLHSWVLVQRKELEARQLLNLEHLATAEEVAIKSSLLKEHQLFEELVSYVQKMLGRRDNSVEVPTVEFLCELLGVELTSEAKEKLGVIASKGIQCNIHNVMVARMARWMPELVVQNQSSFVKGLSISENILFAQELVKGYGRKALFARCVVKIRGCIGFSKFSMAVNGGLEGFFPGARGEELITTGEITRFKVGQLPVRYLGVPLVTRRLTKKDYAPLVEKVASRVEGWSSRFLSYAGRLQLIQSLLYSIQAYSRRHFVLPKVVEMGNRGGLKWHFEVMLADKRSEYLDSRAGLGGLQTQGYFALIVGNKIDIMGYMLLGKPIAIVCFKTYEHISMTQAVSFLNDFKIGQYMKIPPRSMFVVQGIGTVMAGTVNLAVAWLLLTTVEIICQDPWSSRDVPVTESSSMNRLYGVRFPVGPKRIFVPLGNYSALNFHNAWNLHILAISLPVQLPKALS
ncbi:hypothetical protein F3Y22_tig00116970pilonHSYRG00037 [Hibiscus syriacus]|uniref:Uncharacterized protein n=1 Tax=Hibiscus syriacus TaxID=106335 RepID=A0A6A2XWT0_HIBSY|nr:hypothetical protein F3Y22_tig00116970pilonHSYRG00037 [Hibiscus syriacus]